MIDIFVKTLVKNLDIPKLLENPEVKKVIDTITELRDLHRENNKILREIHAKMIENSVPIDIFNSSADNRAATVSEFPSQLQRKSS